MNLQDANRLIRQGFKSHRYLRFLDYFVQFQVFKNLYPPISRKTWENLKKSVSVLEKKVSAPIPILDLGFGHTLDGTHKNYNASIA